LAGQLDGTTNPGGGALNPIIPGSSGNEGYIFQYNLNPTVISNDLSEGVLIYPNPAIDWILIEAVGFQSVDCFDMQGRLVLKSTSNKLFVADSKKGIYLLKVNTGEASVFRKIVIQ
jgi:hypothetical protein